MFTFSFNWLQALSTIPLEINEVTSILNLQGLEVQKIQPVGEDIAVTIEVKANRPDALSHRGVLREIYAYNGLSPFKADIPEVALPVVKSHLNAKISITASKKVPRFCAKVIESIDNRIETPIAVQSRLTTCGINLINPVVDILNYYMLETGQPLHAYDLDKIDQQHLQVTVNTTEIKMDTLAGTEVNLPTESIIISDANEPLIAAGIIGGKKAEVTHHSKNIMIEAAIFDSVSTRLTGRKIKVSTPSSFRFERGVDIQQTLPALVEVISEIIKVCGGHLSDFDFDSCQQPTFPSPISLSVEKADKLLGIELSAEEMAACLSKYGCEVELQNNQLNVTPPHFRLDLIEDIDLIEEIARAYGYHNIKPSFPHSECGVAINRLWDKCDKFRDFFVGLGFYEVINYAFIPQKSLARLNIVEGQPYYSELYIENPITEDHALMRPLMLYSLMNTVTYNLARNQRDIKIFEIGRTYCFDDRFDTGYREEERLGLLFTGVHTGVGFGVPKNINFAFEDLMNYIALLQHYCGIDLEFQQDHDLVFMNDGAGFSITYQGEKIGFMGEIKPSVWQNLSNGKLLATPAFYLEVIVDRLEIKPKQLSNVSSFPNMKREYNFMVQDEVTVAKILEPISSTGTIIESVDLIDIYRGKGIPNGAKSVLLEVTYGHQDRTLTAEDVTKLEEEFLAKLASEDIKLRA